MLLSQGSSVTPPSPKPQCKAVCLGAVERGDNWEAKGAWGVGMVGQSQKP